MAHYSTDLHPDEHYVAPGTHVIVTSRNNQPGVVVECEPDYDGWDVLVQPDDNGRTYWAGSSSVVTADQFDS